MGWSRFAHSICVKFPCAGCGHLKAHLSAVGIIDRDVHAADHPYILSAHADCCLQNQDWRWLGTILPPLQLGWEISPSVMVSRKFLLIFNPVDLKGCYWFSSIRAPHDSNIQGYCVPVPIYEAQLDSEAFGCHNCQSRRRIPHNKFCLSTHCLELLEQDVDRCGRSEGSYPSACRSDPIPYADGLNAAAPIGADNREVGQPHRDKGAKHRSSYDQSEPGWWANLIIHPQRVARNTVRTTLQVPLSTAFARVPA